MQSLVRLHMMMIDDSNQILANFKGAGIRRGGRELTEVRPVWVGWNINWLARAVWVVGEGARSLALVDLESDRSGSARM